MLKGGEAEAEPWLKKDASRWSECLQGTRLVLKIHVSQVRNSRIRIIIILKTDGHLSSLTIQLAHETDRTPSARKNSLSSSLHTYRINNT